VTKRAARVLGKVESGERFLRLALYQGVPGRAKPKLPAPGAKPALPDPTLLACAYGKQRLFLFSRREPADADDPTAGRCARLSVDAYLKTFPTGSLQSGGRHPAHTSCGAQHNPSPSLPARHGQHWFLSLLPAGARGRLALAPGNAAQSPSARRGRAQGRVQ